MAAIPDHQLHHVTRILSTPSAPSVHYLLLSTLVLSVLFPLYRFVLRDYHDFLSLGPGGTPSTFAGYLRVTWLRLFTLKDPFTVPSPTPATVPTSGYLLRLPVRGGPRPTVAGIAPHRQLNQKPPPLLHQTFRNALHELAAAYPTLLRKGNSCFEKHGLALFLAPCPELSYNIVATHPGASHVELIPHPVPSAGHLNPTCGDTAEICHLHASVSRALLRPLVSIHMNLFLLHRIERVKHKEMVNSVATHRRYERRNSRKSEATRFLFRSRLILSSFISVCSCTAVTRLTVMVSHLFADRRSQP